jgi:hypothetical protein
MTSGGVVVHHKSCIEKINRKPLQFCLTSKTVSILRNPFRELIVTSGFYVSYAQARPVPTQALISAPGHSYSKADFQTALASKELKTQLEEMGVDPEQLNDS